MRPFRLPGFSIERLLSPFPQRPALVATLAFTAFYLFQVRHAPLLVGLLLALPVAALNYGALYFLLRNGAHSFGAAIFPKVAVAVSVSLAIGTGILQPALIPYLVLFLLWLLLQILFRKGGLFYTGYTGLVIFSILLFSQRLLFVEEVGAFYAMRRLQRGVSDGEAAPLRWEQVRTVSGEPKRYRLTRNGALLLVVTLPPSLHFHDPAKKKPGFEHPEPGVPVAFLSSSSDALETPPSIAIFELDPRKENTAEGFIPDFKMFLGYRKNTGELIDLVYEGVREFDAGGIPIRGVFWSFLRDGRKERTGLYLLKTASGLQFALILNDIDVAGFPHHPARLSVLHDLGAG